PQLGSFKAMGREAFGCRWSVLDGLRQGRRGSPLPGPPAGELGDGLAQPVEACAGAGTHENARDPTILVALDGRGELAPGERRIDLVPDENPRHAARPDLLQHLLDVGSLR